MSPLVWACGLLCLQLSVPAVSVQSWCTDLPGYDLETLAEAPYWRFSVAAEECSFFAEENITSCYFYFSVCRPLPSALCPSPESGGVSMCQVVTFANATVVRLALGNYSTEREHHPVESSTLDGFVAEWQEIQGSPFSNCTDCDTVITVSFTCDSNAPWGVATPDHDVTNYHTQRQLHVLTEVRYAGACYLTPTVPPSHCSLPPYDEGIRLLASRLYWYIRADPSVCLYSGDLSEAAACTFYFAFCHPLPPDISENCVDSVVCQVVENQLGSTQSYRLGRFTNSTQFYQNEDFSGGFHVLVGNGTQVHGCHTALTTEIIFICNSSAHWNETNNVQSNTRVIHDSIESPCLYIIIFQYAGACLPVTVGPTTTTLSSNPSPLPSNSGATPTPTSKPTDSSSPLPRATSKPTDSSSPLPRATSKPTDSSSPLPRATSKPTDSFSPLPRATSKPTDSSSPLPRATSKPTDSSSPLPRATSKPTDSFSPLPTPTSIPASASQKDEVAAITVGTAVGAATLIVLIATAVVIFWKLGVAYREVQRGGQDQARLVLREEADDLDEDSETAADDTELDTPPTLSDDN